MECPSAGLDGGDLAPMQGNIEHGVFADHLSALLSQNSRRGANRIPYFF